MSEEAGKVNVYVCTACAFRIVTRNRDEGTTPFMIGCRRPGCLGLAESSFYRVPQDLEPMLEWINPTPLELVKFLEGQSEDSHDNIRQHVAMGGLIEIPVTPPMVM